MFFRSFGIIGVILMITFSLSAQPVPPEDSTFLSHNIFGISATEVYESLAEPKPRYSVFEKAYRGFLRMKEHKLVEKSVLTIIDFDLSSVEKRLWVFDMDNLKLLFNDWVAHGKRSGEEYAQRFSNVPGSNMSSTGFYATGKTYVGKHGLSLYLDGVEKGINDNARRRAIVMHGASYVSEGFIKKYRRLGRSLGCPALPVESSQRIIEAICERSCLYIHARPDRLSDS